jgi:hypothetical protein
VSLTSGYVVSPGLVGGDAPLIVRARIPGLSSRLGSFGKITSTLLGTWRMFESVRQAWISYCSLMVATIPADDVRHDRAAEVRTRLGQLDIILKYLRIALDVVAPDPQELKRANSWAQENYPALTRGEITMEQWINGASLPCHVQSEDYIEAWESITDLLTGGSVCRASSGTCHEFESL